MIEVTVSHRTWRCWQGGALALLLMVHALPAAAQTPPRAPTPHSADYIAAVVNQELVTASEVELRLASIRADAQRAGARLPPEAQLRRQVLDDISWPERARPEMSHGVRFFATFRDLTASGFWTSKMGIEDLGYQGNVYLSGWEGCPPEALRKLGLV